MVLSKKRKTEPQGWLPAGNGYEKTSTETLIHQKLQFLAKHRPPFNLVAAGRESSLTVLLEIGAGQLLIDRPADWPASQPVIRGRFKGYQELVHHFKVKVLEYRRDTILTSWPQEIYRLQRREHFRVDVPEKKGLAVCRQQGEPNTYFNIRNVSLGGMLCCTSKTVLPVKDTLHDFSLFFVSGVETKSKQYSVYLAKGRMVRLFRDDKGVRCCGIAFESDATVERDLMQYIRTRELELLRTGQLPGLSVY